MMDIDIKKIMPTPKDKFEAIELMNHAQQELLSALWILDTVRTFEDISDHSSKRITDFIKQYEKK